MDIEDCLQKVKIIISRSDTKFNNQFNICSMTMMNEIPAMIQNYKVNTHKAREGKQKRRGERLGIRGRGKDRERDREREREKGKHTQS